MQVEEYKGINLNDIPRYTECIEKLHPEITWFTTEEGSYQGDWFAVGFDKEGKYYFQEGSYGSCSGCDWYESLPCIYSYETRQFNDEEIKRLKEYIDEMNTLIKIGDNKEEALNYLEQTKANSWTDGKIALERCIKWIKGENDAS